VDEDKSLTCQGSCPFNSVTAFRKGNEEGDFHGGWKYDREVIKTSHVPFDPGFGRSLVSFITSNTPGKGHTRPVTVGDIGAGVGQLGAWLIEEKVTNVSWYGWDGGENIQSFVGEKVDLIGQEAMLVPHICWIDASSDISLWLSQMCAAPYDWVVSVEVGEHVPADRMDFFVDNLVRMARHGVILTWAVPGQGGRYHVNEMDNAAVIEVMKQRELEYDETPSINMRNSVEKLGWLRNTIMVFRKSSRGSGL